MLAIRKKYLKIYGYILSDSEILDFYLTGELLLTDKQEDEILKYFKL